MGGQLSTTPREFRGRQQKGSEANRLRRTHTAADSQPPRQNGGAAATARAKDPAPNRSALETSYACALRGRRTPGGEASWEHSLAAPPRKLGVFRAVL